MTFVKINRRAIKHLFSVLIALFLFLTTVKAQQKGFEVGFGSGLAIPFGKFSSANLDNGSFALPGVTFKTEAIYYFEPKIGAGISMGMNLNPVDVSTYGQARVDADPFLEDVYIRSDPYMTITAMAGGYARIPINERLTFSGNLLAGLLYGQTPYQLHKPQYFLVESNWFEITSAKDWKLSWMAGTGIQYAITDCLSLNLEFDILYDALQFDFNTANGLRTDTHTISLINTRIMLSFRL